MAHYNWRGGAPCPKPKLENIKHIRNKQILKYKQLCKNGLGIKTLLKGKWKNLANMFLKMLKRIFTSVCTLVSTQGLPNNTTEVYIYGPGRAGRNAGGTGRPGESRPFCPLENSRLVEPKTRTYHGRVGSERPTERPGGVGQDWVPTKLFAQETKVHRSLQGIEETSLQRLSRSTNMRNPM